MLNLMVDAWLPVRRASGSLDRIRPALIADRSDDPFVDFASSRPDFNAALWQFVIALLQTTATPEDEAEWRGRLLRPPTVDELDAVFGAHRDAFELGGDGPRFMQDLDSLEGKAAAPISYLLMEAPTANTQKQNIDFFVKREQDPGVCPACAATALFTLQINAPSGGAGHRTSLRGGGPLTTILRPDRRRPQPLLWSTAWLNVLSEGAWQTVNQGGDESASPFPWLRPCRVSEKSGGVTTPQDVNPLEVYWGMPRRIRLALETVGEGTCATCARAGQPRITAYRTQNYGTNYQSWRHPLTAYSVDPTRSELNSIKAQPRGLAYRDWLGLVAHDDTGKNRVEPARVVAVWRLERSDKEAVRRIVGMRLELHATGYDMDIMKARNWHESRMPVWATAEPERFERAAESLVQLAELACNELRSAVRRALYGKLSAEGRWRVPRNVKLDKSLFESAARSFWDRTERIFFEHLDALAQCVSDDRAGSHEESPRTVVEGWLGYVRDRSVDLFDAEVRLTGTASGPDPRAIVTARGWLRYGLSAKSKQTRELLEKVG